MLSDTRTSAPPQASSSSLNAPYGAPHFLTSNMFEDMIVRRNRLNAHYGAPCFLTEHRLRVHQEGGVVLMHLMALHAF